MQWKAVGWSGKRAGDGRSWSRVYPQVYAVTVAQRPLLLARRQGHESRAHGVGGSLDTVLEMQLLQNVVQVVFHGAFDDAELEADLCVAHAFGDELEHLV